MTQSYRLDDEPLPSRLEKLAANPFFPLLSLMFAGAWLAWPWFALNGAAMGSPTRKREWSVLGAAFAGSIVIGGLILWIDRNFSLSSYNLSLAILALHVWKLGCGYYVQTLQSRTFELFEYYGGRTISALPVLGAGILLNSWIMALVRPWELIGWVLE